MDRRCQEQGGRHQKCWIASPNEVNPLLNLLRQAETASCLPESILDKVKVAASRTLSVHRVRQTIDPPRSGPYSPEERAVTCLRGMRQAGICASRKSLPSKRNLRRIDR